MKKLASIVFLFVAVAGSFAQTRVVYEVYAVAFASQDAWTPVNIIAPGAQSTDSVKFTFYVWLLKGNNGKIILVDTGFLQDSTHRTAPHYQRPDSALFGLGVKPGDISDIIITHPHYDHIGGLDLFPKATVWMQKSDFAYFVGDAWQEGVNNRGLNKEDVPKLIRANLEGRLHLVNGDSIEILPGIRVFTGSRHTFGSQHLLVRAADADVMLASDDAWFYYNLDHAISIPLTFDTTAYATQLKRMKAQVPQRDLIVPGHDTQVLSRYPSVAKGIVRIR